MPKKEFDRPSTMKAICERLADGASLVQVCKEEGMPKLTTVYEWLAEDKTLADMYARARESQAETMADQIVAIADQEEDPQKARVRIDARKWVAAKLLPRKYGERVQVEADVQHTLKTSFK